MRTVSVQTPLSKLPRAAFMNASTGQSSHPRSAHPSSAPSFGAALNHPRMVRPSRNRGPLSREPGLVDRPGDWAPTAATSAVAERFICFVAGERGGRQGGLPSLASCDSTSTPTADRSLSKRLISWNPRTA